MVKPVFKFNVVFLSLLVLVFAVIFQPISSAKAVESEGEFEVNEKQLDLALEIAESDLTQTTIVKDGLLVMKYDSYKEANVSKQAFKRFSQLVDVVNSDINKGIVVAKGSINDVLNTHPEVKDVESSKVTDVRDGEISTKIVVRSGYVLMSNSETNKAIKIVAAAGAIASFAAVFLITMPAAAIVATAAGFIGAGLNLCNWNNKGIMLRKLGFWTCTPRF